MIKNCLHCNKEFKTKKCLVESGGGKYCSSRCYVESQKTNKLGENNPNWRGGVPKCSVCGKSTGKDNYPMSKVKYCLDCYIKILSQNGSTRWNWKGGISKTKEYKRHHDLLKRDKRRRNAVGSYTLTEWEALKMKYGYMCLCCKRTEPEISLTRDHIVPLIKGGSNTIENIQPLCRSCNNRKYTKIFDYRPLINDLDIKLKEIYEHSI